MVDPRSGCRALPSIFCLLLLAVLVVRASAQEDAAAELARVREALQRTEDALADARAEAAGLTQALRAARADTSALQARVQAAEGTAVQMTRARDQASHQAAELRSALAQAERDVASARKQTPEGFDQLTREVLGLREALAVQERALSEARDARVVLETEVAAAKQLRTEAEAVAAEALQRADALADELEAARAQLAQLEQLRANDTARSEVELANLRQRLQALEQEGRHIADQNRQQAAAQAQQRDQVELRILELDNELAASRNAVRRLEEINDALQQERTDLLAQLDAARAENKRLASSVLIPGQAGNDVLARRAGQRAEKEATSTPVHSERTVELVPPRPIASVPEVLEEKPRLAPTRPGGRVAVAATSDRVPANRIHVVVPGDSLTRISMRYYGTPRRWDAVYEANRAILSRSNGLQPGQRLTVP